MGDVIMFRPPRAPQQLDAEVDAQVKHLVNAMKRESVRRSLIYGRDDFPGLQRVLNMYPMFRLTHANRPHRCLFCDHRIAPFELHFVMDGSHVCQSGTCMPDRG